MRTRRNIKSNKSKTRKQFLYNPNNPKKSFDVYIDKNPKAIYDSWKKVNLLHNFKNGHDWVSRGNFVPAQFLDYACYLELFNTHEVTEDIFIKSVINHKQKIQNFAHNYKIPILYYNFDMGWEPFCQFTDTQVPTNTEIPRLNVNTMFDKYIE